MKNCLCLILSVITFSGPALGQGVSPQTSAGTSPANPAYVSTVQNGTGTNSTAINTNPATGAWTYSGTGSTVIIGPIDSALGVYQSVTFSNVNPPAAGAGGVLSPQVSNDPISDTWVSPPNFCVRVSDLNPVSGVSYNASVSCGLNGFRYFRVILSSYTSGTDTGFYNASPSAPLVPLVATQTPAIAPTVTASGGVTSLVLKASTTNANSGVRYFGASNSTATAGWCILYNGTTAPSAGALTPALVLAFKTLPANNDCAATFNPPIFATVGAVVLLSSAATPYTYTTGTVTGSIYGEAQ